MHNDLPNIANATEPKTEQDNNSQSIIDLFANQGSWEGKYRQILQLSKSLAPMDQQYQCESNRVKGCESDVWLHIELDENTNRYTFSATSNARIVRGLLVIILAAFQNTTSTQIAQFDIKDYFSQLDLLKHLSPSRANGIYAITEKISQLGQS